MQSKLSLLLFVKTPHGFAEFNQSDELISLCSDCTGMKIERDKREGSERRAYGLVIFRGITGNDDNNKGSNTRERGSEGTYSVFTEQCNNIFVWVERRRADCVWTRRGIPWWQTCVANISAKIRLILHLLDHQIDFLLSTQKHLVIMYCNIGDKYSLLSFSMFAVICLITGICFFNDLSPCWFDQVLHCKNRSNLQSGASIMLDWSRDKCAEKRHPLQPLEV